MLCDERLYGSQAQALRDLVEPLPLVVTEALLPDKRIDYVLVGRPRRGGAGHVVGCAIAGAEPVDGVVPSDHYAVVADLRY